MFDLEQFPFEATECTVTHKGVTVEFKVRPVDFDEFCRLAKKKQSNDTRTNAMNQILDYMVDDDGQAVSKEWVEALFKRDMALGIKISKAINDGLGIGELEGKKV